MSQFVLNLVRRGAGLAPMVPMQPPFTPVFMPESGPPGREPEPEMAAPPAPTPSSDTGELAEPTPSARPEDAFRMSVQREKVGSASPPPATSSSDTCELAEPTLPTGPPVEMPHPRSEGSAQPHASHAPTSVPSAQEQVPSPEPPPRVEPADVVSSDALALHRLSASPSRTPKQSIPLPQKPFEPSKRAETEDIEAHRAIQTTPVPGTKEASEVLEAKGTAKIEPAMHRVTKPSRPVIKPAPVRPPEPLTPEKPAAALSEIRPIQVRIGTIEVRATSPPSSSTPVTPPLTTTPQGFGEYALVRNYRFSDD